MNSHGNKRYHEERIRKTIARHGIKNLKNQLDVSSVKGVGINIIC